jgi:hypothetical protein
VLDALLALCVVILDPGGVIRVAAGEEGEGVDVADGQFFGGEMLFGLGAARGVHRRRIGVVEVGHELNAAVADAGDEIDRFIERVFFERVGGEGEAWQSRRHAFDCRENLGALEQHAGRRGWKGS